MPIKIKQFDATIDDLTPTSNNPRQISKKDLEILKRSLIEFPEMKSIREVVVDENMVILGGHQRIKALKAIGEKTVPVKQVFGLTDESMKKEELLDELGKFYTKEKQEKYGVVGIRIDDVKCPKCGEKLAPWLFGEPTYEAFLKSQRKEIVLGGCMVSDDDPSWHCFKCDHDFDEKLKDLGKTETEEEEPLEY